MWGIGAARVEVQGRVSNSTLTSASRASVQLFSVRYPVATTADDAAGGEAVEQLR
jgi:hypothetical protein